MSCSNFVSMNLLSPRMPPDPNLCIGIRFGGHRVHFITAPRFFYISSKSFCFLFYFAVRTLHTRICTGTLCTLTMSWSGLTFLNMFLLDGGYTEKNAILYYTTVLKILKMYFFSLILLIKGTVSRDF